MTAITQLQVHVGFALGIVTTSALIVYLITMILLKVFGRKGGKIPQQCCTVAIQVFIALSTAFLTFMYNPALILQ